MRDEDSEDEDWMQQKGLEVIAGDASGLTPELWAKILAVPSRKIVRYDKASGDIHLECGHRIDGSDDKNRNQVGADVLDVLLKTNDLRFKCQDCYGAAMRDAERLIDGTLG